MQTDIIKSGSTEMVDMVINANAIAHDGTLVGVVEGTDVGKSLGWVYDATGWVSMKAPMMGVNLAVQMAKMVPFTAGRGKIPTNAIAVLDLHQRETVVLINVWEAMSFQLEHRQI